MIRLSYRASRMVQSVFLCLSLLLSLLWTVAIGKATNHYFVPLFCLLVVALIAAASFLSVLEGEVPRSGRWTYPLLTTALLVVTAMVFASIRGQELSLLTEVGGGSLLDFAADIYILFTSAWLFPLCHLAAAVCGVISTLMALPQRRVAVS